MIGGGDGEGGGWEVGAWVTLRCMTEMWKSRVLGAEQCDGEIFFLVFGTMV